MMCHQISETPVLPGDEDANYRPERDAQDKHASPDDLIKSHDCLSAPRRARWVSATESGYFNPAYRICVKLVIRNDFLRSLEAVGAVAELNVLAVAAIIVIRLASQNCEFKCHRVTLCCVS